MLKTIAFTLLLLVGTILIYAATRPDSFRIERSLKIQSAPDRIFALINDFHRWKSRSPWEKIDLFFSMEKMVGGQYEEGLAKLKELAER